MSKPKIAIMGTGAVGAYAGAHMAQAGKRSVNVQLREEDAGMELLPWIDPYDFNPGYLMRAMDQLPKRGAKPEWQHTQDYWHEREALPAIDLDDGRLRFD